MISNFNNELVYLSFSIPQRYTCAYTYASVYLFIAMQYIHFVVLIIISYICIVKEGLSGSVINEIEVNDRWCEMQQQARKNLNRLKELEKQKPKPYIKNGIGYHTEGFKDLAKQIMNDRCKERFKRTQE